jgi:brefeldin A-inhibited guanine nucleotide-exchange protein
MVSLEFSCYDTFLLLLISAQIVNSTYELSKTIYDRYLIDVIAQSGFKDLMFCLADLSKNLRFQKTSLHSVELLRNTIPRIMDISNELKEHPEIEIKEPFTDLWFPILFAFHEIIMNGEDLEVRSRALNYLFDTLVEYGGQFEPAFWDSVCRKLLFPIFIVLKSRSSRPQDDLSVWLSTTMIQALRNMIALLTHYFDTLERMLDGFLELLVTCIDQENDTVSRIGSSCMLQLVEQNVKRLTPEHWKLIVDKIEHLFVTTTAHELLDNSLLTDTVESGQIPSASSASASESTDDVESHHRNITKRPMRFKATIVKSILQLLMIDTIEELIKNDETFKRMPTDEMLRISMHLRSSYLFARKFNGDRELRLNLWREGFMKQMPNLLKQESTAALTYVTLMMRLYKDDEKLADGDRRDDVEVELIPLSVEILKGYNKLEHSEQRYINTLWPVVVRILDEYSGFKEPEFQKNVGEFYPEITGLLSKDLAPELRDAVQRVLTRIGDVVFKK